ncbi:ABC transporter permease [Patescibacteria group bacterium]|nr:ABC transporter permease [Patescibacteria group bacterium]
MINRASHFWELLWGMTERELRARYKNTVFGFIWLIANPVLQMLIIGFVFPLFIKGAVQNYNFYLLTGLLAWNFFSLSLSKTTPSIVNERSLIKKAFFPREVIPISMILSNFINYLAAFVLFMIPIFFLNTLTPSSLIFFLIGLMLLVLFTVGASLLTSALNVRFRDINFFVQAVLIIWFYATPIIYSLSQIPRHYLWLWRFNPLTSCIQLMQHALVGSALPGPGMIAANTLVIGIILILGVYIFRKESKNFDDWL